MPTKPRRIPEHEKRRDEFAQGWHDNVDGNGLPDDASAEYLLGWRAGRDALLDMVNRAAELFPAQPGER